MDKKGWIVWTWSKVGSLIVFTGMMLMLLAAYSFVSASEQSDAANQLSRSLRNLVLDAYNSGGGMAFEYELPKNLNGEDYSVEVLRKGGDMAGIITRTRSGAWEAIGGSSLAAPLSNASFGLLKPAGRELLYVCIVNGDGRIYLERSRC